MLKQAVQKESLNEKAVKWLCELHQPEQNENKREYITATLDYARTLDDSDEELIFLLGELIADSRYNEFTFLGEGVSGHVVEAVSLLRREVFEDDSTFINIIATNELSSIVKAHQWSYQAKHPESQLSTTLIDTSFCDAIDKLNKIRYLEGKSPL